MIKNIKKHEGLWGFGIISVLWVLGIIFAGELFFIDTIELGWSNTILSSVFPFAFLIINFDSIYKQKALYENLF